MAPKFDLSRVQAADISLEDGESCVRFLIAQLGLGWVECYDFAKDVLGCLSAADFCTTVHIEFRRSDFDEYCVELTPAVLSRWELTVERTWYVKLQLVVGDLGDETYVLSLHKMKKDGSRAGGVLKPSW